MSVKPEFKIIADHLRSSAFLIADGILPSNEGRGYVLRRIMRRAMRQIHKLGAKEIVMHKLVDSLIKEMAEAYPELARARSVIVETLKNEEEKFRETLEKGLKILEEEIVKITSFESSNSNARNAIKAGSIFINEEKVTDFNLDLNTCFINDKFILYHLLFQI